MSYFIPSDCETFDANTIPPEITEIRITWPGIPSLKQLIGKLPEKLTYLNLSGCSFLKKLPESFPADLIKLDLSGCDSLEELPELPEGLIQLNLFGCNKLSSDTIAQLEALNERNRHKPNFELTWPEHLINATATQAEELIKSAYKQYYANDDNFKDKKPDPANTANYPTLRLFRLFVSKSVEKRGDREEIARSALEVAQDIEKNPQMLKFIDEISRGYLDGCVNQPVAGFTEVAILAKMANASDISAKLEIAKTLMAINLIREEASRLAAVPVTGTTLFQVELANVMLKEVHKQLLDNGDITDKWPGVPDKIAYQDTIQRFLTKQNINTISGKVKEILSEDKRKVADCLCEGNLQDAWAHMVLSKEEIAEIYEPLKEARQKFSELLENQSSPEVVEEKVKDMENIKIKCMKLMLTESKQQTFKAIGIDIPTAPAIEELPAKAVAPSIYRSILRVFACFKR